MRQVALTPGELLEHRNYVSDGPRLDAYERALRAVIRPGARVLDLGAGTCILGLLALRAGAGHVCSVDAGPILELGRAFYRRHGYEDRVQFVAEASMRAELPRHFDVVVCDQLDPMGFEARLLDYFDDARRRFLVPGGVLVPAGFRLDVAAIESQAAYDVVDDWKAPRAGFDLSAAREAAVHAIYNRKLLASELLGPPCPGPAFDLSTDAPPLLQSALRLPIERAGALHGLGISFDARLAPGVHMSTSPLDPRRIQRTNAFLPLREAVAVRAGDVVTGRLRIQPALGIVTWSVEVPGAGTAGPVRFEHSNFDGLPVSLARLHEARADRVPTWTPRQAAALHVLEAARAGRTIGEIEASLRTAHPDVVRAIGDVRAHILDLLDRADGR